FIYENSKKEGDEQIAPIYVVGVDGNSLTLQNIGDCSSQPELLKDNYTDVQNKGFEKICEEFSKKNPMGRLSILSGKPGTGKTFFIRSLISKIRNRKAIVIPSNNLETLNAPQLISLFIDEKDDMSHVQDLDDNKNKQTGF